ncbi:adhesion G protein-coupled receptor F5-like [Engystomops pustulosus]|uniref:adhesion G protein-coupled receptor F5-like n=1 Tax=Engystomops pustulosus TaxID=76066 RepID=UPI003AFB1E4D
MRLQWIFIFLMLACWIAPTEEKTESWDLSSLMSYLFHGDHEIESDTVMERSLSRGKRATAATEYTVDIEISFPDASLTSLIRDFITKNLTYLNLNSTDTQIKSISVTTACNQIGSNVQCTCESGYMWPTGVCNSTSSCPGSGASSCNCIQGTSIPAQYCQPKPVSMKLSLKLLEQYTDDLKDPTSAKYKKYKADLEAQFAKAYGSLSGFQSATVTGFRPGSVVADYTLVTEPTSTTALTTANNNLVDGLKAANYSVSGIKNTVYDNITITYSPGSIYYRDTVLLTCIVSISSFTNVAWYLNATQPIAASWYTTSLTDARTVSVLTLNNILLDGSGTYSCIVEDSLNSYQANTTISVQPLDITVLNTNVACNNRDIPVMQCCTQGLSTEFYMTCSVSAGLQGVVINNSLCKTYQVTGNKTTCGGLNSGSYDCTCYTMNGANGTRNVKVTYQATYSATVTPNVYTISEGKYLTMDCSCDATSVNSITWFLQNTSISSENYTVDLATCKSTLTILTTMAWNGTYQCSVNTGSGDRISDSKDITVFKLIKSSQISVNLPVFNFQENSQIPFSCCISDTTGYKQASLQITLVNGITLPPQTMTKTSQCFTATYQPVQLMDFTARCNITNDNNDNVVSSDMQLKFIKEAKCTTPYVGAKDSVITVSCGADDPTLTGTKNLTCNGVEWKVVPGTSTCRSAALDNIKNQIDALTSPVSKDQVPNVLGSLSSVLNAEKENISASSTDILIVISALQTLEVVAEKIKKPEMQNFLNVVDVIVNNTGTWENVPDKVQQSSNLLQSVEKFAEKLTITGPITLKNNSNIQLEANTLSNLTATGDNYMANFEFTHMGNLTGNILIDKNSLSTFPSNATVVSVAYATLKDILNATSKNSSITGDLNGLVMTTTVSENYTDFQIEMNFTKINPRLNKTMCVFWNFKSQDWDNTGCRPKNNSDNTTVTCICDHLTSFSILMSYDYPTNREAEIILTFITYIGLGISMLSLVICIVIEATVWKSVTKNKTSYMRHVCIMNIAVTLLMADIWFIVGGAMSDLEKTDACVAATFFTHLFYLCTFFWMLTMGLILFYRLMCIFHDLSKTVMMGISFFLGYGCPIIITVITVAVTQPSKTYTYDKKCWLNMKESMAFLAFIIPALTILLVNFVTLFVVIIKVLRPSVGDKPKKEERSSLNHITKCILILTPLLGLTWGFGIGTMSTGTLAIHGIFAALNSLQGLFILLFGCLMDKKVRDALFSRFSVSRWSSQQTKTSNLSSTDPVFSRGVINLFGKKGVYNISSAQATSSSEASNSYSLLT